jgi:hypothetical protein
LFRQLPVSKHIQLPGKGCIGLSFCHGLSPFARSTLASIADPAPCCQGEIAINAVRRSIFSIAFPWRKYQRRITLNKSMLITPHPPTLSSGGG